MEACRREEGPPGRAAAPAAPGGAGGGWCLLWEDSFEREHVFGPDSCWEAQLGDGSAYNIPGWGNAELQSYTDRPANVRIEAVVQPDGSSRRCLVVQAAFDPGAPDGQRFTSARLRTAGRFSIAPGQQWPRIKIEARLRITPGQGLWPAVWLLPEDNPHPLASGFGAYGGWAASGELDVLEMANDMREAVGSIHFGAPWPGNTFSSGRAAVPPGTEGGWHVHAVEWSLDQITWLLDGQPFSSARSRAPCGDGGWYSDGPGAGPHAPFDKAMHLLINLALGSEATEFTKCGGRGVSQQELEATLTGQRCCMVVDYVRVLGQAA
ncbi:hypothetical protein COHA_003833 [Chlorella ohadii]|uniref:GH16 domain-containing protein n=1 Tax=Chlorella ohadii TaxID=2649997 RepID=A0AAD5H328_9CHLO|nr:hypothetical protein COHA_003833 [Chlorella ohadii]